MTQYDPDAIYFYAQTEAYAEFSNFAPYGVAIDDMWWRTVEHYFQAQKFDDPTYRERIRGCTQPKQAKALGMTRALPIRADWDDVRDEIMQRAVTTKFATHAALAEMLLATGNRQIVENAPMDYYWGCGADGTGQNRLGLILMAVRETLRHSAPIAAGHGGSKERDKGQK